MQIAILVSNLVVVVIGIILLKEVKKNARRGGKE